MMFKALTRALFSRRPLLPQVLLNRRAYFLSSFLSARQASNSLDASVAQSPPKKAKATKSPATSTKKTTEKKKAVGGKKAAAKKPAAKPKTVAPKKPKVLDPEEILRQKKNAARVLLREPANSPPIAAPFGSFMRYHLQTRDTRQAGSMLQNTSLAAEEWRKLSEDEKKKYDVTAEEKAAYRTYFDKWIASKSAKEIRAINSARKLLGRRRYTLPAALKGPPSAYILFQSDIRNRGLDLMEGYESGSKLGYQTKKIGKMWNELSADEKEKYLELARAEKAKMQSA